MNFFAAQEQARQRTRLLLFLFTLAVCALLVLTNLLVLISVAILSADEHGGAQPASLHADPLSGLPWELFGLTSAAVIAVISIVVLLKQQQLAKGGQVVAKALGGQRLQANESDAKLRQLHNVVTEMAIAAGMPVPAVYLLPEAGINAFAAGWSHADAVIGVTQGCVNQLSRDELQGVIAHEFSHILNGDMRLNIRLLAYLHGIVFISEAGGQLLRLRPRSHDSKNSAAAAVLLLGLGLLLIGALGVFFAQLIKAAVSRQREYLADASAVQFTRNPNGIAGALQRIALAQQGGRVQHAAASEMSHLFFANALSGWQNGLLGRLFATHPPLSARIKRLNPHWDGNLNKVASTPLAAKQAPATSPAMPNTRDSQHQQALHSALLQRLQLLHSAVITSHPITDTSPAATAQQLTLLGSQLQSQLQQLPLKLQQACYDKHQVAALLLGCLLTDQQLAAQLALIKQTDANLLGQLDPLLDSLCSLHPLLKLTLLQQAAPILKRLSFSQQQAMVTCCRSLILHDSQLHPFELVIWLWLMSLLGEALALQQPQNSAASALLPKEPGGLASYQTELQLLFWLISQQTGTPAAQIQAFMAAMAVLGLPTAAPVVNTDPAAQLNSLATVLPALQSYNGQLKQQLWQACLKAVHADKQLQQDELLWLHLLALLLEVPLSEHSDQ